MNGHDNPSSTVENVSNDQINENAQQRPSNVEIELKPKTSPLMILSLTLHSLGIIFGDM